MIKLFLRGFLFGVVVPGFLLGLIIAIMATFQYLAAKYNPATAGFGLFILVSGSICGIVNVVVPKDLQL